MPWPRQLGDGRDVGIRKRASEGRGAISANGQSLRVQAGHVRLSLIVRSLKQTHIHQHVLCGWPFR